MSFKVLSTVLIVILLFAIPPVFSEGNLDSDGLARRTSAKFPTCQKDEFSSDPDSFQRAPAQVSSSKSAGKAFFLSFLVPGLGEFYAGSSLKGKIFLAVEAAIWSGFGTFEQYSAWKRRDYELFSVAHAGVNLDGKDDDFFKNVGMYQDVRRYNADQLHARNMDEVYWDEDFYSWEWDSVDLQAKFSQIRDSSRKAHRRALNMVGVAVLNRLVSAIDAARTARAFNKRGQEDEAGLSLDFKIRGSIRNPKAMVVLTKNF